MYRILLVEDEKNLAHSLKYNLNEEGYSVVPAIDGEAAVSEFSESEFDLVILDIMLPKLDGFEVLKKIRASSLQTPVLVLTARSSIADRVLGLEIGADDYLTKPFHLAELLLRVKGMLRRKKWYKETSCELQKYIFGDNIIDFDKLTAVRGKRVIHLTSLEASLLSYFIANQGEILTREEILVNVWNIDSDTETRTVENFIVRLRKYFEPAPAKPIYFKTIRGTGYLFNPDRR